MLPGHEEPSSPRESGATQPAIRTYATMCVSGMAVMAIEILGTRVIAPFYGASLYVWAAMISVTLVSLSLGYWLGGIVSERGGVWGWVSGLLGGAGAYLGVLGWISPPLLEFTDRLGLRGGVIASATVLFAPPLVALAMVGPLLIGSLRRDSAGRAAGSVYAVSTLAGVVATLLTAFWLLPAFPLDRILAGLGGLLLAWVLCLGVSQWRIRSVVLLCAGFSVTLWGLTGMGRDSSDASASVIYRAEGALGTLRVIDAGDERWLMIDAVGQGVVDRVTRYPITEYVHMMGALTLFRPQARRCLMLGLGTGSISRVLATSEVATDVVEIDPEVLRVAEHYFEYTRTGTVFLEDARLHLRRCRERYDFVVLDVFNGGCVATHLASSECMRLAHNALTDGGVLAVNFLDLDSGQLSSSSLVSTTLRREFKQVRAFRGSQSGGVMNVIFFCSDSGLSLVGPGEADRLDPVSKGVIRQMILHPLDLPTSHPITDAWNPLEEAQIEVTERLRRVFLKKFGTKTMAQ